MRVSAAFMTPLVMPPNWLEVTTKLGAHRRSVAHQRDQVAHQVVVDARVASIVERFAKRGIVVQQDQQEWKVVVVRAVATVLADNCSHRPVRRRSMSRIQQPAEEAAHAIRIGREEDRVVTTVRSPARARSVRTPKSRQ